MGEHSKKRETWLLGRDGDQEAVRNSEKFQQFEINDASTIMCKFQDQARGPLWSGRTL